jgi:integrase
MITQRSEPALIDNVQAVKNIKSLKRPVKGLYLFNTNKGQPYTGSRFASIWQRKMRAALKEKIISERFREHDLRAKTASDTGLQHASELLAHGDKKITERHYMRKPKNVLPLR